jgi:ribosomal protein S18 acetylase RimI-like enzyme
VIVVTHGGPIRVVLALVEGIAWSNKGPQQALRETGVSTLAKIGGTWRIACRDDIRHLAGLEVHRQSGVVGDDGVIIRPLVVQDVDLFLTWRATDDYLRDITRKEIQQHLEGRRVLLVAESDGQLVGTIQFVPTHEDRDLADGKTTAYLQALEVREHFRGRGLGTWLIHTVERAGVDRGFKRLTLMVEPGNAPAISLYRKLGFEPFKDSSEVWRGSRLALTCMWKPLTR